MAGECNVRDGCKVFNQAGNKKPYSGPISGEQADICLTTLAPRPQPLVLREGYGVNGHPITSWRVQRWKKTNRGYEKEVCVKARQVPRGSKRSLCGESGHSRLSPAHIAELHQKKRIPKEDAVCIGGKAWCAERGL